METTTTMIQISIKIPQANNSLRKNWLRNTLGKPALIIKAKNNINEIIDNMLTIRSANMKIWNSFIVLSTKNNNVEIIPK
nr:hypothetical protein [uncultured Caproiciproducens sp.]